jgi:hypothetical protein
MPRRNVKKGKRPAQPASTDAETAYRRRVQEPPLPSPDTIVSESVMISPKKQTYRVIRTTQQDPYDSDD